MKKKIMILKNGNIITLDSKTPRAEAILIEDGIIKDIGKNEEIDHHNSLNAELIDLKGKTVVPGFIDAHNHLLTSGLMSKQIILSDSVFYSINKLLEAIQRKLMTYRGYWVRAWGFNEELFAENRLPTRYDLDKILPYRPIVLTRVCGHLSVLNSKALEELGIINHIEDLPGGKFIKDDKGNLTGIVTETAQQYILDRIPEYNDVEIAEAIGLGQNELLKNGICSIHDPGTDQILPDRYVEGYIRAEEDNKLKVRTYLMSRPSDRSTFDQLIDKIISLKNYYNPISHRLSFGAVKLFADGSLGGKTAAVEDGYLGDKENKGILLEENLDYYIEKCHIADLQIVVHAIGDRAIRSIIEKVKKALTIKPTKNHRHRIEHCELCSKEIINLLKTYHIIPVIQPAFIYEFGPIYVKNIGLEKANQIKPYKSMINKDIVVAIGTDFPVVSPNPMCGLYCAAKRKMYNGEVLNQLERVEIKDALKGYTINGAYASFTEQYHGTLEIGKLGDLVVLSDDPLKVRMNEIQSIQIEKTIVGGELLYGK